MAENFYPQFVNINLDALKATGLTMPQYAFCFVSTQYQSADHGGTGWVECGVRNPFYFPYPLKLFIGERCGLYERKTNRIFKKLTNQGFIEVSNDKQKFRVTDKFFVFKKTEPVDFAKFEGNFSVDDVANGVEALRKTFEKSVYFNSPERFKEDMINMKITDIDFGHYHQTIQNWYTVERPEAIYVDWARQCKKWIDGDRRTGRVVKPKQEKADNPKVPPIAKLTDEQLCNEVDLFYTKMVTPETDSFEEYKETAETFSAFANEALKRGDRILSSDQAKQKAIRMLEIIKKQLRPFYEQQRARTVSVPAIEDLAKDIKNKV